MGNNDCGRKVFISYASKEIKIAEEVRNYLEQNNITCWIAPRDILPGTEYGEAIMNGIESCRVMVLIFSKNSNSSQHVLREVERAVAKNVPIIAYKISNTNPCKSMEYFLLSNQWLDASSKGNHLAELHSSIQAILPKEEGKVTDIVPIDEKKTKSYRKAAPLVISIACLMVLLTVTLINLGNNKIQAGLNDGTIITGTDHLEDVKEPEETNTDHKEQVEQASEMKEEQTSLEQNDEGQSSIELEEDQPNLDTDKEQASSVVNEEEQSNNEPKEQVPPNKEQEVQSLNQEESVSAMGSVTIGDLINFGSYEPQGYTSKNEDSVISWIVVDIDKKNNQLVLLSEKILDMKSFDVAESGVWDKDIAGNSYDRSIKDKYTLKKMIEFRGNSDWEASNIRTWLNSDAARVTYTDQEPCSRATDEGVNSYNLQTGFLYGFSKEEKAMLLEKKIKTTLNGLQAEEDGKEAFIISPNSIAENYDFSSYGTKITKDKVSLLSLDEVQKYLFKNNLLIFSEPTQSAIDSDKSSYYKSYLDYNTKYCAWLLRTPNGASAQEILAVGAGISNTADVRYYYAAAGGLGIRPAITISLDQTGLDGEGTKEHPFIIVK